jgi:hypothetical protein
LDDLGVDGKIKIKMDLQEVGWEEGLDLCGSKWAKVSRSCKCGNEAFVYIKYRVIFNLIFA